MSKNVLERDVVVFDLETTGIDLQNDEIVQFAGIRWSNKNGTITKKKELEFLCRPSISIPKDASNVHGITNEAVKNEKSFDYYTKQIEDLFLGTDLSGFNIINFDVHILNRQMAECGIDGFLDSFYFYDAYKVYVEDFPRNLGQAYESYTGKNLENAHNALADVEASSEILFEQMSRRNQGLREISESHSVPPSERVGMTDHIIKIDGKFVVNFGKWSGKPIESVDKGYIRWIIKSDLPKAVKDFVSKYV